MGRSLGFNPQIAIERAAAEFWKHGYEGTSLTNLTRAMNISRPSLYLAFGDKEALFVKVLEYYHAAHLGFVSDAFKQPTAEKVIKRLVYGYVDAQTSKTNPPGCLGLNGALACSEESEHIRRHLAGQRAEVEVALRNRLIRARKDGDLKADSKPADLARFIMVLVQGTASYAMSGGTRSEIKKSVDIALQAWPSAS